MGGILFAQHTTHTHTLFSQTGLTLLLLIFGDWIDWFSFQYIIFFIMVVFFVGIKMLDATILSLSFM